MAKIEKKRNLSETQEDGDDDSSSNSPPPRPQKRKTIGTIPTISPLRPHKIAENCASTFRRVHPAQWRQRTPISRANKWRKMWQLCAISVILSFCLWEEKFTQNFHLTIQSIIASDCYFHAKSCHFQNFYPIFYGYLNS